LNQIAYKFYWLRVEINFFNPRSVVFFVCLLQGAVFTVLLFWRGRQRKSHADRWLAVLLILLCLSLITPFIGFASVYNRYQWLTFFPFNIAYSLGVCVYFYVLSLTNSERKFTFQDLLLFVPALIYVVFRLILFAQNLEFKDWFDDNYYVPFFSPLIVVSEFLWNLIFLLLALKHYRKYRAWLDENFSDTERIKFNWLRNFLYVFTFVFILGSIFDFTNNFVSNLSYIQYFYFQIVLALATYYLAIAGYLRSAEIEPNFEPANEIISKVSSENSVAKPLIANDELERLKMNLQNLMTNEKPYLEPQLTLADLSQRVGLNTTFLSYVINQGFGKNFNDFINDYRVAAVKEKLESGAAKNLNLLGIAFECGFNSKATFNRTFKKIAGVSPKEYQTQIKSGSNPPKTSQIQ
jgi:AraC-like DNA-binding protein